MNAAPLEGAASRLAQMNYLAQDPELGALLWEIAALPDEARLIVRMMVDYLRANAAAAG
jgi:hypothetical protein